jgi:hypothetical protein
MRWNISSQAEFDQWRTTFDDQGFTGTISFDLPRFDSSTYGFSTYSGTVLEPQMERWFAGYPMGITWTFENIRT